MKTWKRINLLVILAVLLVIAVPAITYAGEVEGITARSSGPEIEITGELEEIGDDYVVVDGQPVIVGPGTEVYGPLSVGDTVEIHARPDGKGSLVAREIEPAGDDAFNGNDNDDDNTNAVDDIGNTNDDDLSNSNESDDLDNGNSNDHDMSNANDDDDDSGDSNDDDMSNANDDDDLDNGNSSDDDMSNSNDDDNGNSNDDSSNDHDDDDDDRSNDNDDDDGDDDNDNDDDDDDD